MDYLTQFQEMLSFRGLTEGTVKTYTTYISSYLEYLQDIIHVDPCDATWDQMRDFITWIQQERGISDRTVNCIISQLSTLIIYVIHRPWDPTQIPRRKFDRYIPFVPSRQEMADLINAIEDRKARTMVIVMYSAGLRVSEVCNLQIADVSRARKHIQIAKAKNRHARLVPLSEVASEALVHYWRLYRPSSNGYFFPSPKTPGKPVSTSYVANHIRKAEEKLGWDHRFTCHSARHGFATHFFEDHGDLMSLKEILGHRSINSTTIYISLASTTLQKYASPIDSLKISYE